MRVIEREGCTKDFNQSIGKEDRSMLSIRYLLISTIGLVLLLGAGCVANPPQKVQDGAKVTVGFSSRVSIVSRL